MLLRIVRRLATWNTWFLIGLVWCAAFVLWFRAIEPPLTVYARDCIFITSIGIIVAGVAFALATALLLCVRFAWRKFQPIVWSGAGTYRVKGINRDTSAEGVMDVTAASRKSARIKTDLAGWVPVSLHFMSCQCASEQQKTSNGWVTTYAKLAWSLLAVSVPAALLTAPWSDDWQKVHEEASSVQRDFRYANYGLHMGPGRLGVAAETSQPRSRPRGLEVWSIAFKQSSMMGTIIERAGERRVASGGNFNPYESLGDEGGEKLKALLRKYPSLRVDLYAGPDAFESVNSEAEMLAYLERRTQAMVNRFRFSQMDESVAVPIAMLAQLPDVLIFMLISVGGTLLQSKYQVTNNSGSHEQ